MSYATARRRNTNGELNKLHAEDRAAHEWYRFVLSFPPHLVRGYLDRFHLTPEHCVLDPFCGTGTTIVECKKLGIQSIGVEANHMAHFASVVKANWSVDADALLEHAAIIAERASAQLCAEGIDDEDIHPLHRDVPLATLPDEAISLLLTNSISPIPLHKTLVLLEVLEQHKDERYYHHERLALAKALVTSIGNLHFGPEVGIGIIKNNTAVIAPWLTNIRAMANDLRHLALCTGATAIVHHGDARSIAKLVEPGSIDAVITSPPYPNEKDYSRTTRLETVLLGFVHNKAQLRELKKQLVRSNTRGVYKDDTDDTWIADNTGIQQLAKTIEERRIELGKTSGFERLYGRVTKLYFGGMAKHLAELRPVLQPGAHLAYVVGDQASYFRIMIRTGQILAEIAESLGYEVVAIELFRTRIATATKQHMREEVIVLRWPG